mmetsp:Transcript_59009/g.156535  ORF Transcript_59009/g.156535 Transcript_59009/m.156535 type:complete len:108 (-) Transcript_59009:263-586(-)
MVCLKSLGLALDSDCDEKVNPEWPYFPRPRDDFKPNCFRTCFRCTCNIRRAISAVLAPAKARKGCWVVGGGCQITQPLPAASNFVPPHVRLYSRCKPYGFGWRRLLC